MVQWKDVLNWEEYYEVSNQGQVRNKVTGHVLVGDKNSSGYCRVCLYNKNHKPFKQRFFIHRLVAQTFIPNPNNLKEVNHVDSNTNNNCIENLEWIDKLNNEHHSRVYGSKEFKPFKITMNDGSYQCFNYKIELADKLGVTPRTIKNWLDHLNTGYLKHGILTINYI